MIKDKLTDFCAGIDICNGFINTFCEKKSMGCWTSTCHSVNYEGFGTLNSAGYVTKFAPQKVLTSSA